MQLNSSAITSHHDKAQVLEFGMRDYCRNSHELHRGVALFISPWQQHAPLIKSQEKQVSLHLECR